jgi:hypothetical protein
MVQDATGVAESGARAGIAMDGQASGCPNPAGRRPPAELATRRAALAGPVQPREEAGHGA